MGLRWSDSNRNEKNKDKNEWSSQFRNVNIRYQQSSNVWVLLWLYKTKVWKESKVMLYGYR